jgi:hypothetical protein
MTARLAALHCISEPFAESEAVVERVVVVPVETPCPCGKAA